MRACLMLSRVLHPKEIIVYSSKRPHRCLMTSSSSVREREREREEGRERNTEREVERERGIKREKYRERERVFLFKRNDGCLGTF